MNPTLSQGHSRMSYNQPHIVGHPSGSVLGYGPGASTASPSAFGANHGHGHGQPLSDSITQNRPQYQPGYLLSLAQGQALSVSGQRHEEPLLIPTRAKMNASHVRNAPSDFGSDSMFETSTKHRHREAAIDEDGPPMSSVVDLVSEIHVDSRRQLLNSARKSTTTRRADATATSPTVTHQTLYIIVFGYPPARYSSTLAHFQSLSDGGTTEPELSLDVENAFRIGYKQPWEAARALRRNGEVINGEGGRWMVGVKWMDPIAAEQVLGSGARISANPLPLFEGDTSMPAPQDDMDMDGSPDPALSQLLHVGSLQQDSTPSVGTPIKLAPSAAAFRKGTPDVGRKGPGVPMQVTPGTPAKSKGMLGQVSDLVFGW